MFKALLLDQVDGRTEARITRLDEAQLPPGEVLVEVAYSTLNYKDGLAVTGTGKIINQFPAIPGVDFAGRVLQSEDERFKPGMDVVLNGWGVGERHWGGFAELARVKADWLTPLPAGMTPKSAMAIGTAGLTAMLCVMALEEGGVTPEKGPVVVTGASGGVGSFAVALLSKLGYSVSAVTGRPQGSDYLQHLGAGEILDRETMSKPPRPLEKQRWAGAVDTVGGEILARVLAQMLYGGTVAACGLAASYQLPTTVMPFILRNVRLQGVDSVYCPPERRQQVWSRLQRDLNMALLADVEQVIELEQVPEYAQKIVQGQVRGRAVIKLKG